ncbi:MAG TPA: zinc ribbon domain-containing protein [Rhizomicrobium sp.]
MYCQGCGTELSDEANFCSKCGRPQKPGIALPGAATPTPAIYEVCDTRYQFLGGRPISTIGAARVSFFAAAISPKKGKYSAAESPEFKSRKVLDGREIIADLTGHKFQSERDAAFADLVEKLLADGWERTQSGQNIYRHSFRRLVT